MLYFLSAVRLAGIGNFNYRGGRVEVYHKGIWGTVCDDGWDLMDAQVVCRELGFKGAVKAYSFAFFGRGKGKIWMENVQCTGWEKSLKECPHRGWGRTRNCGHSEDAGVMCTPGKRKISKISNKAILYLFIVNNIFRKNCSINSNLDI